LPVPVCPKVTVIQLSLLVAVLAHVDALAVTLKLPVLAPSAT
jgi:hypothetical protein